MAKEKPVCTECGSDEVLCDAWAEWDEEAQEWVLNNTFDHTHCSACDGECSVNWVEAKDEEDEEDEIS